MGGSFFDPQRHVNQGAIMEHKSKIRMQFRQIKNPTAIEAVGFIRGGDRGTRTPDPLRVEQVLYQLSYTSAYRRGKNCAGKIGDP